MSEVRATTIVDLLERSNSVIIDEHGISRTTADVLARGRRLAGDMFAAGLTRGDRFAVQMTNGPLYLDLLAAAAVGGFVVMSVNLRFGEQLSTSLIKRSGARFTIRGADDLPASTDEPPLFAPAATEDRYVIFTTSGTTSAPKLVVHQQRSIVEHAGDVASHFAYDADSVVMVPLPLCGVFGFTVLFGALAGHCTVIMPTTFEADETDRLIEQYRVSSLHGSDDMFHRLLATDHDLSSIDCAGYGRFNSSLDGIVERCEARGVPLSGLYGMSEVQALYAFRGAEGLPLDRRWQPGGPLTSPRAMCRVVDGELQLQGPSLFEGYLADGGSQIDHELTGKHLDGPWFCTGDMAEDEGSHSFRYITRIGDVMRLGGFLVAPTEVESVLIELPSVEAAQVVAVSLPDGTRPVAYVIAAPGASVDEAEAIAHCQSSLAKFKSPVRVVTIDEFPVTDGPNGVKIQRAELRRMALALFDG